MPQNHHHAQLSHDHNESDLADLLDLDADVFGSYIDDILDVLEQHAPKPPFSVADIGAGTGTGSLALARRFTQAQVFAIDSSPLMIKNLSATATKHGLGKRMHAVQADLDIAWPDGGPYDVAWAASSLHHFADPDRVLQDVYGALTPGGLLALIELDSLPRFLPDDIGLGRPGLESRLHEAMALAGWNAHPDWRPHLERAGFELVEQRPCVTTLKNPTAAAERHARTSLAKARASLSDRLDSDDIAALDRMLADYHPDSPLGQKQLKPRSHRTIWVARRPA